MTNLTEGNAHAENEPDINHLDIGGLGKGIGHTNIPGNERNKGWRTHLIILLHGCQHQHHGQVDGDDSFKEEGLEVDGDVTHGVEKHSGNVDGGDVAEQPPAEHDEHPHPGPCGPCTQTPASTCSLQSTGPAPPGPSTQGFR